MLVYGVDRKVVDFIKWLLDSIKNLICGVCFLAELILVIVIIEKILKNTDLGLLILYFIGCEFVLSMFGETSLVKCILSVIKKD